MKRSSRTGVVGWLLAVAAVAPIAVASDPGSPEPDGSQTAAVEDVRADRMSAWSVDSGGGESSGGDFSLTAAIGQPDAGVLVGGDTVLAGGLWAGAVDSGGVFFDGFESGDTGGWSASVGETR